MNELGFLPDGAPVTAADFNGLVAIVNALTALIDGIDLREATGLLVIDWPHPRPIMFEITAEVFEALVALVNIERSRHGAYDGDHLIEFREDGWTIQHTLAERLNGTLFDCPRSTWTGGDPGLRGRYVLNEDGTIGDEVARPDVTTDPVT